MRSAPWSRLGSEQSSIVGQLPSRSRDLSPCALAMSASTFFLEPIARQPQRLAEHQCKRQGRCDACRLLLMRHGRDKEPQAVIPRLGSAIDKGVRSEGLALAHPAVPRVSGHDPVGDVRGEG